MLWASIVTDSLAQRIARQPDAERHLDSFAVAFALFVVLDHAAFEAERVGLEWTFSHRFTVANDPPTRAAIWICVSPSRSHKFLIRMGNSPERRPLSVASPALERNGRRQ